MCYYSYVCYIIQSDEKLSFMPCSLTDTSAFSAYIFFSTFSYGFAYDRSSALIHNMFLYFYLCSYACIYSSRVLGGNAIIDSLDNTFV